MPLSANDITYVLSGGNSNRDKNRSLGGQPSVQPIVGTFGNLFDDVTTTMSENGGSDYRCFYVFNDNTTDALYNTRLYLLDAMPGGVTIELGFITKTDIQLLTFSNTPSGGVVVFRYENHTIPVEWGGNIVQFADNLVVAFNAILGNDQVSAVGSLLSVSVTFSAHKFQSLLTIDGNTTGSLISVSKVQNGSPINAVAGEVDSETTPPSGVTYIYPTEDHPYILGDLLPSDGFPVWVKRTIEPGTTLLKLDGFTIRISGSPAKTGIVPSPN